ncbi:MAG: helix-turn-helix transcriptional regulator, partial [Clostridia bacterium]|nr:helix-turn-helix transcriptional regulator [Clostridia bacterium]
MEWLTAIRGAVSYAEDHLTDDVSLDDVARAVHLSPFFLQRGFSLMTGYGIGEYIRNRRLYQAALDLKKTEEKVIDVALRYGYETPESFTKAFARFHGATPTEVRNGAAIRTFLPLTIQITIQGGNKMEPKITPLFPFKLIGFQKEFTYEEAYSEIPRFWNET